MRGKKFVSQRGFVGIGVLRPKTGRNMETLVRSAKCFGADFVFGVGQRFPLGNGYSCKNEKHIPVFYFDDLAQMTENLPSNSQIVCVEITDKAKDIQSFNPPERAVYLLGPEDGGLPEDFMKGKQVVRIPTKSCLNVAMAGTVVLYHDSVTRLSSTKGENSEMEEE